MLPALGTPPKPTTLPPTTTEPLNPSTPTILTHDSNNDVVDRIVADGGGRGDYGNSEESKLNANSDPSLPTYSDQIIPFPHNTDYIRKNSSQDAQLKEERRLEALAKVKEICSTLEKTEFGLGISELNQLCDFIIHRHARQYQTNPQQMYGAHHFNHTHTHHYRAQVQNRIETLLIGQYGGVEGVALLLKTSLTRGLEIPQQQRRPSWGLTPGTADMHSCGRSCSTPAPVPTPLATNNNFNLLMNIDMLSSPFSFWPFNKQKRQKMKVAPTTSSAISLKPTDADIRKLQFGSNIIPPPRMETIPEIIWSQIKEDIIIKILLLGGVCVLVVELARKCANAWIDGSAIFITAGLVLIVTGVNEWYKNQKLYALFVLQSNKKTKVIRSGVKDHISSWDVLVGDLVEIVMGDEIPADGLLVEGNHLMVDEAKLVVASGKWTDAEGPITVNKGSDNPFLFAGSCVVEGFGVMLVTSVGVHSALGRMKRSRGSEETQKEQSQTDSVQFKQQGDASNPALQASAMAVQSQGTFPKADQETRMQKKIRRLALEIGKVGVASGVLTFIALFVQWSIEWVQGQELWLLPCVGENSQNTVSSVEQLLPRFQQITSNFVVAISVLVVAIPEGLPLAVTISLAFSMYKMMADKCSVKHLDALQMMSRATCICTGKSGTLTENRTSVVALMTADGLYCTPPTDDFHEKDAMVERGDGANRKWAHQDEGKHVAEWDLPQATKDILCEGICINSTTFLKQIEMSGAYSMYFRANGGDDDGTKDKSTNITHASTQQVGCELEGALLVFCHELGVNYNEVRKAVTRVENGTWSFSSDRKRMSTLVRPLAKSPEQSGGHRFRLYTKGAAEIILGLCTHVLVERGSKVRRMTAEDFAQAKETISAWASKGLRLLALAFKDTDQQLTTLDFQGRADDPEHDLVFLGIVGIHDPLRKEVPDAVTICKNSGMSLRLVTGDHTLTACKIARECGILSDEAEGDSGLVLDGSAFRAMSNEEKLSILPRLRVLARASALDKLALVSLLKSTGQVVAMSGDHVHDVPSLK
ncbi:hypothetical protein HK102_008103, partial [Quaeritorhiza haematococci]